MSIRDLALADDRIYVLDGRARTVAAFDLDGQYLGQIGRNGQGPGEYQNPLKLGLNSSGDVFVRELDRVHVFDSEGRHLRSIPTAVTTPASQFLPFVIGDGGSLFVPIVGERGTLPPTRWQWSMREYSSSGVEGADQEITSSIMREDFEEPLTEFVLENGASWMSPPFLPRLLWAFTSAGDIVSGVSDRPEVTIHPRQGGGRRIQLRGDRAAVDESERRWHTERLLAIRRQAVGVRGWDPATEALPEQKPWFSGLFTTPDGHIWVVRPEEGVRLETCNEAARTPREFADGPCWADTHSLQVYSVAGSLLADVDVPAGSQILPLPSARGNRVAISAVAPDGEYVVRVYHLEPALSE